MPRTTRGNPKLAPAPRMKERKSQIGENHTNDNKTLESDSAVVPEHKCSSDPSQVTSTSKRKKIRHKYSEMEKNKIQEQVTKMQESPTTSRLPMKSILARVPINHTSYYRWQNECKICFDQFAIKHGRLVSCHNCKKNICLECLTKSFVRILGIAPEHAW